MLCEDFFFEKQKTIILFTVYCPRVTENAIYTPCNLCSLPWGIRNKQKVLSIDLFIFYYTIKMIEQDQNCNHESNVF